MHLIHAIFFAIGGVSVIGALQCHKSEAGGKAGTLVHTPGDYAWQYSDHKFGACFISDAGKRGLTDLAFRGDIDHSCIMRENDVVCYCATDGCNAEMPDIKIHMSPKVNCVSPTGKAFTCGGDSGNYGNVCGTWLSVDPETNTIRVTGTCVVSLGEKWCNTWKFEGFQSTRCVGNMTAEIQ